MSKIVKATRESIKDININIKMLQEKINDLKEKYNINN